MDILEVIRTAVLCYLIGSFPTAYLVGRLNGLNIFEIGSGNMGTTNTLRALGWGWGGFVLTVDLLKGVLAVLVATFLLPMGIAQVVGALAAIVGHNWSIFAAVLTGKLRGGKGAATWLGTFLVMAPWPVIAAVGLVFFLVLILSRYVSLAVLTSVAVGGLGIAILTLADVHEKLFLDTPDLFLLYAIMAAGIIFYRHRSNIQRLRAGTERRLGEHL